VDLTGDSSVLVRHFSNAKAVMYALPQGDASINEDMYIIRNGNETAYADIHTFENVLSDTFTFSAEDSEGNIATKTLTLEMIDYIKLTCNVADRRPDASGNMTLMCTGAYFNGSFGQVSNTLRVRYKYRESGGSWSGYLSDMTVYENGNAYMATASLTGLDYHKTYDFEFVASDKLMTVHASTSKVKSVPLFHWGENDVVFEVPVTFVQGTEGASIPTDILEYGTWTPNLYYCSRNYSAQYGWYSKVGNVVTVGFYIKATIDTGYEEQSIAIGVVPFKPVYAAAGGGMCSGALIQTNKNFQCFVVESDGEITTRAQACDSTSGTNLATSASGCRYPSGELTLSGTITYMTND
jgi:hypothetical protein